MENLNTPSTVVNLAMLVYLMYANYIESHEDDEILSE